MEIILLEKIENLGAMGDKVIVSPGYGRNYLVPQGKAKAATAENIAEFEARRAELEQAAAEALAAAEARRDQIDGKTVEIVAKAGDEGKLFGSIGTADIADAIKATGVEIERNEIRLPEGAFRQVGEYDVVLHLHTDVDATIKLVVRAE
ncbi:MAG: 50S ribosomal protein L9 [Gammaproteobacteria bacterium]|nr:50S ribosomal protein L9 [Gammaproteobacteria bacterium]MDH5514243.1 50S ribosomal protein L9 [Gammaproteobacteria bacterium]